MFDYTKITPDSVSKGAETAIAAAASIIEEVVAPDNTSTYDTTVARLDEVADILERSFGETAFLGYVHPDPQVRAVGHAVDAMIQQFAVELAFRDDLYAAVKAFSVTDEAATLEGEPARLLEFVLRDFRKAGHELDAETRAKVKEMTGRLVDLGVEFQRNIDEHEDALVVTPEDLVGLPHSYVQGLQPGEEEGTLRVTMAYPDVVPFLENASRRDLRQQLSFKFNSRAVEKNRPLLEEAVELRGQIAAAFGEPSWAHHQLEERMAKDPKRVEDFYAELLPPLTARARSDLDIMSALLVADGESSPVQVWDWRYYDTLQRKNDYGVDPNEVAAYFPLEGVLEGMLALTGEVFGLRYERIEAPTWHPDVITYAVYDSDGTTPISFFHMDLFPREGKFSHAAAFTLVPGRALPDGGYQRPISAIVANFTKPGADRPSLLQHNEVETLFHEFGHILHQTLTKAQLVRFSGSNTERDFVEAPSQIMEHWTWRSDVLRRFARHHQTGEPIPEELVDQLVAARRLNISISTLRQIQFGKLDMGLHGPGDSKDLDSILEESTAISLFPLHEGTFFPASFGHMFGYDAGYYGYLWSEVFGDDMFSRFEADGATSPVVGAAYRTEILERGGSVDGEELLRNFLGRDPSNEAFLINLGISGTD